ncbi:N-acetylmuramoyl-L-alanine amidase [Maritalea sp.]|uniref:N-acetylmuramoyl-L-alanine amidase n=1 Tax=Maritalea sp. TaxID=2003361 RepID=UPI003EF781AE
MRHWGVAGAVLALVFSVLISFVGFAQEQSPAAPAADVQILDARIVSGPERNRIVFDLTDAVVYSTFPVDQPDRLIIEFEVQGVASTAPTSLEATGLVQKMSLGMLDDNTARAVIFLTQPVQVGDIKLSPAEGELPARLVLELVPGEREVFDQAVAAIKAENEQAQIAENAQTPAAVPEVDPVVENQAPAIRPLILIDPGHGGIDMGAKGETGLFEKDVVLQIAKRLQSELSALNRFDVALTRDGDTFLTLNERVQLARDNQANLLVSLHADSFDQPFVRGGSVYTRDETATDVIDKVLADTENQVDLVAGFNPPSGNDQVVDILVDLMRRETRRQSFVAARQIVGQMNTSMPMRPHPLRQADFFVLQAPEVPSVLIELGFLSNSKDLANLSQAEWQQKVAVTLARGIAKYFDVSVQP